MTVCRLGIANAASEQTAVPSSDSTCSVCGGTDGLAVDEGKRYVVNVGVGLFWIVDRRGCRFIASSRAGAMTTNVAYGGPDRKTLYLTDSDNGQVLVARMPVPGLRLYSHL